MPDMLSMGIFAGIGTALALGWSYVRAAYARIAGLLIVTMSTEDSDSSSAMHALLWKKFRRSTTSYRSYTIWNKLRRSIREYDYFLFEKLSGGIQVFWLGWKPILFVPKKSEHNMSYEFKFIRGTFDPDELMLEAMKLFSSTIKANVLDSRFKVKHLQGSSSKMKIGFGGSASAPETQSAQADTSDAEVLMGYRPLNGGLEDMGEQIEINEPLQCLALSEDVEAGVQAAIRWSESRNWYNVKRIPWRRGWLLHGPPGNGKSSLARGIAQKLKIPMFVFDLSSMDNTEFDNCWSRMMEETPCVALFEDFDNVFHGRKNITAGEDSNALTFDAVLNAISGVKQAEGVFLIVTTNCVDKIDEALGVPKDGKSTRPGRLDECFYLDNPCQVGRERIARRILGDCQELIPQIVDEGAGDSGAQFQHRCEMIALEHHWKNKPKPQAQNRHALQWK